MNVEFSQVIQLWHIYKERVRFKRKVLNVGTLFTIVMMKGGSQPVQGM